MNRKHIVFIAIALTLVLGSLYLVTKFKASHSIIRIPKEVGQERDTFVAGKYLVCFKRDSIASIYDLGSNATRIEVAYSGKASDLGILTKCDLVVNLSSESGALEAYRIESGMKSFVIEYCKWIGPELDKSSFVVVAENEVRRYARDGRPLVARGGVNFENNFAVFGGSRAFIWPINGNVFLGDFKEVGLSVCDSNSLQSIVSIPGNPSSVSFDFMGKRLAAHYATKSRIKVFDLVQGRVEVLISGEYVGDIERLCFLQGLYADLLIAQGKGKVFFSELTGSESALKWLVNGRVVALAPNNSVILIEDNSTICTYRAPELATKYGRCVMSTSIKKAMVSSSGNWVVIENRNGSVIVMDSQLTSIKRIWDGFELLSITPDDKVIILRDKKDGSTVVYPTKF